MAEPPRAEGRGAAGGAAAEHGAGDEAGGDEAAGGGAPEASGAADRAAPSGHGAEPAKPAAGQDAQAAAPDAAHEPAKALGAAADRPQQAQAAGAADGRAAPEAQAAEPYSQVGKELAMALAGKRPASFSMRLEPAELGKIDVNLRMSNGLLRIDIAAESVKTQSLLAGQLDKLVMSLGLSNVHAENVHVTAAAAQGGQQDPFAGQGQEALSMGFAHTGGGDGRSQGGERQAQGGGALPLAQDAAEPARRAAPRPAFGMMDLTA
jgi:flagellar hook-length control protein FliK